MEKTKSFQILSSINWNTVTEEEVQILLQTKPSLITMKDDTHPACGLRDRGLSFDDQLLEPIELRPITSVVCAHTDGATAEPVTNCESSKLIDVQLGDQGRLDCKSSQSEIPNLMSTDIASEAIRVCSALVKSRYSQCGSIATINDIEVNDPTYVEAFTLLRQKRNEPESKVLSLHSFYEINIVLKNSKLKNDYRSLWNLIVDLFRVTIIYGYVITKESLRARMIRVWLSWSYKTATLEPTKVIPEFDNLVVDTSIWMKIAKYKLAAFAAFAKKSPVLPKCPFICEDNPSIILDREFTQWFKRQREETIEERIWKMSLIDSLCRGVKKGADRSNDADCLISSVETFRLFTTDKEKPTYLHLTVEDMENEIQRSVDEIINDSIFEPVYNLCPSFSSATENSVMKGGHVKVVKQHVGAYPRKPVVEKKHGLLYEPFPLNGYNNTDEENPFCRASLNSIDIDSFEAIRKIGEVKAVPYLEVCLNPENLGTDIDIEYLIEKSLSQDSVIKPIGLKEALKVRGITTPSALETWLLKPLQKFLAKCLLKHAVFAVTGTPLTAAHLERVITHIADDESLISGDYDNATNMMIGSYTRHCVKCICRNLNTSEAFEELAVRSLCDNVVKYRYKDTTNKVEYNLYGRQVEAQPMGKILSFTVLCIINFAVCRKAIELDSGRIIPIRLFPGLINGDDCCFPIKDIQHWVGTSAMVGLFNSIGKTFESTEFVEMNSRTFLLRGTKINGFRYNLQFTEVPFVNFGLMKGLVRSEGMDKKDDSPSTILVEACSRMGWCHRELVKGFDGFYKELDSLFKYYHNKYLMSDLLSGVPFYIPPWLGGLGLDPGPRPEKKISIEQLKCARYIYQNFEKLKPKSMTLNKTCLIDSLINKEMSSWFIQFAVEEVIPNFKNLELEDQYSADLLVENQAVYSAMVEYIWRTKDIDDFFVIMDENFAKVTRKISSRQLFHNQSIWKMAYAFQKKADIKPLHWFKLWQLKQNRVRPIVLKDPVHEYKLLVARQQLYSE